MTKKIIIVIIVVAAAVVLIAIGAVIILSQDEFANWKTYGDEEYGYFSIKYPQTWIKGKSIGGLRINPKDNLARAEIFIQVVGDGFAEGEPEDSMKSHFESSSLQTTSIELDSIVAKKITGQPKPGHINQVEVIFRKDNKVYIFSLTGDRDEIETFNQILSTFKFLESIEKEMGYIEKIYNEDSKRYLDIDYVQYLTGYEAERAAKEDGTHPASSGHYIRNQNSQIRTFEISDNVEILLTGIDCSEYAPEGCECYGDYEEIEYLPGGLHFEINYEVFKSFWEGNPTCRYPDVHKEAPYNIEIKDNEIVKIRQQFIP